MQNEENKELENKESSKKTIEIPIEDYAKIQETFAKMSERIAQLENPNDTKKIETPKFRTVKVWFLDKEMTKMLTGIGDSREINIPGQKPILESEVTYTFNGKKHKQWVDMIKLRSEGKFVDAKIKKITEEVVTKQDGYFVKTEIKDNSYNAIDTGLRVPNKVETPIHTFILELPDGREVELSHEVVN